jgi:acyl carrier protein
MSKTQDLTEMQAWLIERISKALKVKNGMDPAAPFSKYGLQSIDAVILAMEIEEEVGVELPRLCCGNITQLMSVPPIWCKSDRKQHREAGRPHIDDAAPAAVW